MSVKSDILKAYEYRRAIKVFQKDKKISQDDFDFILETGRLSPSSFGYEPWKFLVVQNEVLRKKLMEPSWGAQRQLPSASHFVILLARKGSDIVPGAEYLSWKSEEVDKLPREMSEEKMKFLGNFQKNQFDLTDDRKLFDWASKQVYLPLANMMTAAAQIGIDSCPIEGFHRAEVESLLEKEGVLDPTHLGVVAMVAFGYREEESSFPRTRLPREELVQWIL